MEHYIQYLDQVLGLKKVIWPEMAEAPQEEEIQTPVVPALMVLFVAEKPWSLKASDLFQKMREAMKVPESQSKVLFASQISMPELQISALSAQRVVCFSQNLIHQIQVESELKYLTYDPEELLLKPALKKEAWEELKKVMKSLGLL